MIVTLLPVALAAVQPVALPPAPPAPPLVPAPLGSARALSRSFSTMWIVMPDNQRTPREVSVKGGELILKQRAMPFGLARLTGPAADPKGKFDLTAGTELFRLQSDVPIYCLAGKNAPTGVAKWLLGGSTTHLCLVDADADGRFEGQFVTASQVEGLPTLVGKRPKTADPIIAPAAYAPAAPSSGTTQYWVGVEYQGKPLLYNRRNFTVSFGNGKDKGSLTDWVYTGGTFPAEQTLLGAKWTVLALDGDQLKVRIDQSMPPQPFAIMHSVTYRFY